MNDREWIVRPAEHNDSAALALIGSATFLETFGGVLDGTAIVEHCKRAHSETAYRAFHESGVRLWIATIDPGSAPIGFALLAEPDLPGAQSGDLELKRIYVLSRYHGSGVGAALMDEVIGYARTIAQRLLLGVYAHNHRAIAFYCKNGFEKIAGRQFDVGGTLYDDCVLARALNS